MAFFTYKNTSIKSVITTITKNINNEDSWNVFKDAFDTVDKDFLKKLKGLHHSLTPNDLRLCAYLRLNLSSKEIAPLLNISVRSVEIKRYRLRKKMNLSHENGCERQIKSGSVQIETIASRNNKCSDFFWNTKFLHIVKRLWQCCFTTCGGKRNGNRLCNCLNKAFNGDFKIPGNRDQHR